MRRPGGGGTTSYMGSANGNAAVHERRMFRLLIVDDSNIMRRRIERSQQFDELEVVGAASNGVEAIELFRRTDPDLVTMDLTMPQMDGIECIEQIVRLKPSVRILVISALADKATAVDAMEKGANGFLNKPFTDRQLNEAIAELIRGV
ncbi:MAG TPA: response regulator, partial [Steroidobacteraceae bacterium]